MPFPDLPNPHAAAVLVLTGAALVLFSRERIPLETSSLGVLVALAVGFEVFPFGLGDDAFESHTLFHGFGHEALVAVCALMVTGQGLVRTGALEPVGRILARAWARAPGLSFLMTLFIGAVLSAFINNTPIVVLLLPILASVCLRTGRPVSSVLMPMGFATLVGGMCTTIGTSTNLLVVSVSRDLGLARLGMFDFAAPAAVAAVVAIAYLWLVAPILPVREPPMVDTSPRVFAAEIRITEDGPAAGETLAAALDLTDGEMSVRRVRRGDDAPRKPEPERLLEVGDRLQVEDTPDRLMAFERALGGELLSGGSRVDEAHPLSAEHMQAAEVVVVPGSRASGRTVRELGFRERYSVWVLALHRSGHRNPVVRRRDLADEVLRPGDVLLVQGPAEQIAGLKSENDLMVLDATTSIPRTAKAPLALAIMGLTVLPAATGVLPIAVSAVAGALAMLVTGCIDWRDARGAMSTPVILVVVASLALGSALLATGGTQWLTAAFLALTDGATPAVTLSGLMLLMAVLTNVVSNNAAAVIGTPIAAGIARALDVSPEPFVLAVLFGANLSFATPMAYKTNLLVMTAGGYAFGDFVRVGVPLIVIMWLTLSIVLALLYGL